MSKMKHFAWEGKRGIGLIPGYDHRHNPEMKQYGQHPATLTIAVRGEHGAFVCDITTGWNCFDEARTDGSIYVASHEEISVKNGSEDSISDNCSYLDGRACVCTYSTGLKFRTQHISRLGFDGVAEELEKLYLEHFGEPV